MSAVTLTLTLNLCGVARTNRITSNRLIAMIGKDNRLRIIIDTMKAEFILFDVYGLAPLFFHMLNACLKSAVFSCNVV